jgi:PAS domain-containing protein
MTIRSYSDLLTAARAQPTPQRLLFAFAAAQLPVDASLEQQQSYRQQQGGTLTPVMCVDKLIDDLTDFAQMVQEAQQTGAHWDLVFVSSMAARSSAAGEDDAAVEAGLKKMLMAISNGQIDGFLAFDRDGRLLRLNQMSE